MKTEAKTNMGRWNEVDDKLLARIVIEGVRGGSTQQQALERAGFALNRTSKACGFRWYSVVRKEHIEAFRQSLKEHRLYSGKIRSMRLPDYAVVVPKGQEPTVEILAEPVVEEPKLTPFGMPVGTYSNPIKPAHYHKGGIDVIGFLDSHFGKDEGYTVLEAFCIGNIVKYVTRYKQKNGIEDLEKAQYYLNQLKQQGE